MQTNDAAIWALLRQFTRFGHGADLSRANRIMGPVISSLPAGIVVTGSNGKGTVTHLTAGILKMLGLRVGHFISPHLMSITERISVDGQPVATEELQQALEATLDESAHDDLDAASRFEILAAAAVRIFSTHRLDAIVWEAGLGGRLDPTRLVPKKVAVLTSVALEHTSLLGGSRIEIAREKAAIARSHSTASCVPLVIGCLDGDVSEMLERQQPIVRHTEDTVSVALSGSHQIVNGQIALTAARLWTGRTDLPTNLNSITVPLRTERIRRAQGSSPDIWVDVAHHEHAIRALRPWLDSLPRPLCIVFGVSRDRQASPMLSALPNDAMLVISEAPYKSTPAKNIPSPPNSLVVSELHRALRVAEHQASPNGSVVILGGLYLAAASAAILRQTDHTTLRWE